MTLPGRCETTLDSVPFPPLVDPVDALDDVEARRTARHAALVGLGSVGQRRIAAAHVAVVGAGGLGSPVVLALAAAGVGRLTVIDDDVVGLTNLQRQVMHRRVDVGAAKVDSAVRIAAELSETRVTARAERLTAHNAAGILAGAHVVVDGTDSFDSREIVAAACERGGQPLVWGTVQEFAGQATVFWSAPPPPAEPVVLSDLYPAGSEAPACAEVGVFGPLCLQVGALLAAEVVKLVTGVGDPLLGRVVLIDARKATQREVPLRPARRAADADAAASRAAGAAPFTPHAGAAPRADATDRAPQALPAEVDEPGGLPVIDVREQYELDTAGRFPGARHVPLADLLADPGSIAGPVVVVCQAGMRARRAAGALRAAGVEAVVLAGGMDAWQRRHVEARR